MTDALSVKAQRSSFLGWIDAISKIGIVAGGLFAGWQYWEAKTDKRTERTTAYIERYEDGRVGDARREINGKLRPYIAQFRQVAVSGISPQDRDAMVLALTEENGGDIANRLDTVADFFQGLETCTSEGLCDRRVAEAYFRSSDAGDLWTNFEPYFRERRANNPSYGDAFEHFAQSTVSIDAKHTK